uniref:Uncharacterized protein n=1 Tax=Thermogemmatispora argillosa TaxID=2045280 RepID=A0A455T0N4_9CHLR|nr:hypothetical protein KTA_16890 [Thermogemmatispora argillosa]
MRKQSGGIRVAVEGRPPIPSFACSGWFVTTAGWLAGERTGREARQENLLSEEQISLGGMEEQGRGKKVWGQLWTALSGSSGL